MRTLFNLTFVLIFIFVSCDQISKLTENSDIKIVKEYKSDGIFTFTASDLTIGQTINKMAGISGKVTWDSFTPEKYKNNSDIVVVEVNISKTGEKIEYKSAKLQYLVNRNTKEVTMGYAEFNGKQSSLLEATIMCAAMMMESAIPEMGGEKKQVQIKNDTVVKKNQMNTRGGM